jgi:SAM-dependent methyltransferase
MEYNHYFEYRRVQPGDYAGFVLPPFLRRLMFKKPAPRVLDFGCGFGQMLHALKEAGITTAEGIDIEPAAIRFCRERGFVCTDAAESPEFYRECAGSFDFVLMSHVLEHFPKEQVIPQLEKLKGLLKPGGALIVMVPNAQSHTGAYWAYEDFTHHLLFTSGSLYYVLRAAGYAHIEFLDIDCTEGMSTIKRVLKQVLLGYYRFRYRFWNRITTSAVHRPSPLIFSYEIKALARI